MVVSFAWDATTLSFLEMVFCALYVSKVAFCALIIKRRFLLASHTRFCMQQDVVFAITFCFVFVLNIRLSNISLQQTNFVAGTRVHRKQSTCVAA